MPGLRTVVVTGPRIDPASVPAADGLEVLGYVPDLYRHLAAADLAVVQGGLSTTMELTACRRPFLYVPLRNHFEQKIHVRHRLERHRAGRRLDWAETEPDGLAAAIAAEIGREVDYRPVDPAAPPGPPPCSPSSSSSGLTPGPGPHPRASGRLRWWR